MLRQRIYDSKEKEYLNNRVKYMKRNKFKYKVIKIFNSDKQCILHEPWLQSSPYPNYRLTQEVAIDDTILFYVNESECK